MNSRSGDRVPAGVSGQAGRGTVGTVAPTAPSQGAEVVVALFSPVLWVAAGGYAVLGVVLVWVALELAPWGLLLLLAACASSAASTLCGIVAFGVSRIEADEA